MIKNKYTFIEVVVALAIILIVISMLGSVILGGVVFPLTTQERVEFVLVGKERVGDSDSSKYLLFTESETFENSDIMILGKFESSDIYGQLEDGKTYRATVCGYRIGFLSMYRNVVSIYEVEDQPEKEPEQ